MNLSTPNLVLNPIYTKDKQFIFVWFNVYSLQIELTYNLNYNWLCMACSVNGNHAFVSTGSCYEHLLYSASVTPIWKPPTTGL